MCVTGQVIQGELAVQESVLDELEGEVDMRLAGAIVSFSQHLPALFAQ